MRIADNIDRRKWDELSTDERIERLRDSVHSLQQAISWLGAIARQAERMAKQHEIGLGPKKRGIG